MTHPTPLYPPSEVCGQEGKKWRVSNHNHEIPYSFFFVFFEERIPASVAQSFALKIYRLLLLPFRFLISYNLIIYPQSYVYIKNIMITITAIYSWFTEFLFVDGSPRAYLFVNSCAFICGRFPDLNFFEFLFFY